MQRPRLFVLYHFYAPDDVVSARHYTDLCSGLAERGWDVTVFPTRRSRHANAAMHPAREILDGVAVQRIWRPSLKQGGFLGRIVNMLWMHVAWMIAMLRARRSGAPDAILFGTDPILTLALAPLLKWIFPRVKLAHWCFDLYPEAIVADGMLRETSPLLRILKAFAKAGYRACDLIVDLGPCMRLRLSPYGSKAQRATIVPWALVEPKAVAAAERTPLTLMYSGNFGRAHGFTTTMALARAMVGTCARFWFAGRGARLDELTRAVEAQAQDGNVKLTGFVPEAELERHLASADVHVVTLQPAWRGIVVPSKFFGALAAGRPVLFAGDPGAAVATWIRGHRLGWVLDAQSLEAVAKDLERYARDPDARLAMERRCFAVYHAHFSRLQGLSAWDAALRGLVYGAAANSAGADSMLPSLEKAGA